MSTLRRVAAFLLVALLAAPALYAQQQRPLPYPVFYTPAYEQALEAGTRTPSGVPGDSYWTNTATYDIDAVLSPATKQLRGTAVIHYTNSSPDALGRLVVHLRQNLHKAGAIRNRAQQVTGGMHVSRVEVGGERLVERSASERPEHGYLINGTLMTVLLDEPLEPGATAELTVGWSFEVPEAGAPRMGQDGEVFYLGYWYPQMAVYDDVHGWVADQYQGNGEFYMGYADYDVAITVPEGWLVAATGTLENPDDVLTETVQARLNEAAGSGEVVSIVGEEERGAGTATTDSPTDRLTWRFQADRVRDFAFGASAAYVWDATSAVVGDLDGDGAEDRSLIHSLYRPGTASWERSAEFARFSIEHLSEMFMPYPWPHRTAVEGIIGGGMEYPMITLVGGNRTDQSLFGVTYHEISHMWFPMIVGQNEKAYTWMDEGLTSFNTNEGMADFFDMNAWDPSRQGYYYIAGTGREVEPMRHGDNYPDASPARGLASYSKPAVALNALRAVLGEEVFWEAYRTYAERWAYKHPYPYDLFNTFEDVAGRDLDWFWTPLFYETWTLDQAVAGVESGSDGVRVTVEDQGLTPMPILLRLTYADGTVVDERVPVDVWLEDARTWTGTFEPGTVTRVEIDPNRFLPDVDRSNNTWTN